MSVREKISSFDRKNLGALVIIGFVSLMFVGYGSSQSSGGPDVSIGSNGIQINSGGLDTGGGDIIDGGTIIWDASAGNIATSVVDYSAATASDVGLGNVENENALAEDGSETFQGTLSLGDNVIEGVRHLRLKDQGDSIHPEGMPESRLVLDTDQNNFENYGLSSSNAIYLSSRSGTQNIHLIGDITNGNNKCTLDASNGDWTCDGTKSWVHDLNETHEAVYTSQESGDVRAVFEGKAYIVDSKKIKLPSHFSKTVSDTEPMLRAQATPHELANVAVTERTDDYIVVESSKNVKVDYRVTGIRDGYEDKQVVRPKEE